MENLVGKNIGRYHIIELLGQGGMAVVYKAYDTRLERDVAIKVIRSEAISPEMLASIRRRFEREAKSLAKLKHPYIINIHDYGEYNGSLYLVMEYLPGGTLEKSIGKEIPYVEAVCLLLPVVKALAFAHEQGIIHRDIKPANILITGNGEPMLSDFGIVKVLEEQSATQLTGTGMGIGTPAYMAPEQWKGKTVPQTDIYAMGIVLYELITGQKPYTADTPAALAIKQAVEPLPRPKNLVPGLPDKVEHILIKALSKEPGDRYDSMAAFVGELEKLVGTQPAVTLTSETTTMDTAAPTRDAPRKGVPVGLIFGLGGTLALMAVVGVVLVILAYFFAYRPWVASNTAGTNTAAAAAEISTWTALIPTLTLTTTETLTPTNTPEPTHTPTLAQTPTLTLRPTMVYSLETQVWSKDNMVLVYVPEGEFDMGSEDGNPNERPVHTVWLDAFWIDQTEVTNLMYVPFLNEIKNELTIYEEEDYKGISYQGEVINALLCPGWPECGVRIQQSGSGYTIESGYEEHPATLITWYGAWVYCEWAGRRLPTEAEWEKAARGTDARIYPWGNEGHLFGLVNYDFNEQTTTAVGSYPDGISPYGALDMAGNALEWVADWYDENYYINSPERNPLGPDSGFLRVARGGSFYTESFEVRAAHRGDVTPKHSWENYGFRCAIGEDEIE